MSQQLVKGVGSGYKWLVALKGSEQRVNKHLIEKNKGIKSILVNKLVSQPYALCIALHRMPFFL